MKNRLKLIINKYNSEENKYNSKENKCNSKQILLRKYIIFWFSQSVSQLGSAMTSFALILWVYSMKHSAMTVSLMSFCNYGAYIIVSLFAGQFVDKHSKNRILLASDSIAAMCTIIICILSISGNLQIFQVYIINIVIGSMNAFQSPASSVAIGKMVPKEKILNVSGMNSFSNNLIMVLTPVISAGIYSFVGLKGVLILDFSSFLFAFCVLLFVVQIPEDKYVIKDKDKMNTYNKFMNTFMDAFTGFTEGFSFLRSNSVIMVVVITMAVMNFFSRLTYENILSPMILARSGDSSVVLGIVNAMVGIGGIVGGFIVSTSKKEKDTMKMIYFSAAISFLIGDILMGIGNSWIVWSIAGIAASLPIPFINAGQNVILYRAVPEQMQGRIFAVRNAIQYSTIPLGILFGGYLADYVFEPWMESNTIIVKLLQRIVGTGHGSGMAVMFLFTGILGFVFCILTYIKVSKKYQG